MTTFAIEKAQQDLVTLVKRALDGEDIVIEADSRKVRLAPVPALPVFDAATARRRGYGSMKGQFEVTDAFFEPLPEDDRSSQSILMLASRITRPYSSYCRRRWALNSAPHMPTGNWPW